MIGAGFSAYADIRVKCIHRCSVTGAVPGTRSVRSAVVVMARGPPCLSAPCAPGGGPGRSSPTPRSPRAPLVGLFGEFQVDERLQGADAGNRADVPVQQVEQVVVVGAD